MNGIARLKSYHRPPAPMLEQEASLFRIKQIVRELAVIGTPQQADRSGQALVPDAFEIAHARMRVTGGLKHELRFVLAVIQVHFFEVHNCDHLRVLVGEGDI